MLAAAFRASAIRSTAPCRCSASSSSDAAEPHSRQGAAQGPPLRPRREQPVQPGVEAPWSLGTYYTKKLERKTDSLGNILSSPDTVAAAPGWTPDAQLRLAAEALAPELRRDAEALLEQVGQLQALLPGMERTLARMKPAELVRMAARLEEITAQLLALRERFPAANVAAMVAAHPPLLHMATSEVDAAAAEVQEAFPDASQEELEAALATNPALLDGAMLQRCLAALGHLLPRPQILRQLARDPTFLHQVQPLEGQSRGERDAEYLADMFRKQTQ